MYHFKVYVSVAVSTFTLLYNHPHHPSPELFHVSTLKFPITYSPQPLATIILLHFYFCECDCSRHFV